MLPEVKTLLDVQELDNEIIDLNSQIGKYPLIWEEVKKNFAAKKEAYDKAAKAKERHAKDRRRVEQKIRVFSEDLRRYQAQQHSVKTQKEYEAISKQIESLKEKINSQEELGMELIGKTESIDEDLEKAEAELKEAEEFYKAEKERIRGQFNEKKRRVEQLQKERDKVLNKTPDTVRTDYERLALMHPGSAAVPVRQGSCSGCNFGLLPNDLVQVHRDERLVHCPNCGRILSHDLDYQPEEEPSGARS